jgi:gliding motility-associated-like protein
MLFAADSVAAQSKPVRQYPKTWLDTATRHSKPARLPSDYLKTQISHKKTDNTCRNTTFYLRVPAPPGQRVEVTDLETLPGGDYIAVGTLTGTGNIRRGMLLRLTNTGAIAQQKQITVNNFSATISKVKVKPDGTMIVSGIVDDGNNGVFMACVSNALLPIWVRTWAMPGSPQSVTSDIIDEDDLLLGVHYSGSIWYARLDPGGTIKWQHEVTPGGLTGLTGYTKMTWTVLGLVYNCTRGGKFITEIVDIDITDGSIIATSVKGDGMDENKALAVSSYNVRQQLLTVNKISGTSFNIHRDMLYSGTTAETNHIYSAIGSIDWNVSGAMDNAGDIIGVSLPATGILRLTRHFASYQSSPAFTREYAIGQDAAVSAIARSYDAGILCAVNGKDFEEMIFIKTDSLGILPGCNNDLITNTATEASTVANFASGLINVSVNPLSAVAVISDQALNLSTIFNCQQTYCPAPPDADTCMSTYYKTLRSNSFSDIISYEFLMRSNRYFTITVRSDRIIGDNMIQTAGLKLFDETGNFIKGVSIYLDGVSVTCWGRRMDDKTVMLIFNSSKNNISSETYVLVDDDFNIIWNTSVQGTTFTGNASDEADIHRDAEGNYYIGAGVPGFFGIKPYFKVCKLSASGQLLWTKRYDLDKGLFGCLALTSSATSLYAIIAGSSDGSASVRLDKNSGAMLNSYNYINTYGGGIFRRYAGFHEGKVLYAGSTGNTELFAMMVFDSTGKPLKMTSITNSNSLRAADIKNGKIYATYDYFIGLSPREVVLRADSNLNIEMFQEYENDLYWHRIGRGLDVSPEGNIYVAGNILREETPFPYFMKYDEKGNRGTCNPLNTKAITNDIDPIATPLGYVEIPITAQTHDVPVVFVPDDYGQQIGDILCKSLPLCHTLDLSGQDTICSLNQKYLVQLEKSLGCSIIPQWFADTAFATIEPIADTAANIQFKQPGTVKIEVRLNGGCSVLRDTLVAIVQQSASSLNLGVDKTICPGDSINLMPGSGFSTFEWQDGSADSVFVVTGPGLYSVEATNACAKKARDSIIISAAIVPPLSLGSDTTVCKGSSLLVQAPAGFTDYYWSVDPDVATQLTNITLDITQDQPVSIKAVTIDGCAAMDTLLAYTKEARSVTLGNDTSFCAPASILLSAGIGYDTYAWNTGAITSTISVSSKGIYAVTAQDQNGCSAKDTLVVNNVYPQPKPDMGADFDLCKGATKQLDPGQYAKYQWMDNANERYYPATSVGSYWVKVTDVHHCTGSDTVEVKNLLPAPLNFFTLSTDSVCQYESVSLTPQQTYTRYLWSNGAFEQTISVTAPGIYWLTVTDAAGCSGSDTMTLYQKVCMSGLFVPNAFTPNDDNLNDVFRAMAFGKVVSFRFEIYDRFGQLLFRTTDPGKGWNGSVNGKTKPSGVFAWQCFCKFEGSDPIYKKGTVTLIR